MRLDELRHELHAQADQAGTARDDRAVHRLAEVQGRVHRIRHRRATATAAGAVAAVALVALAVVPQLQSERSAPGPASGPAKTSHADAPNPWEWPQTLAGDTLALGAVSERGQSTLTGSFVPEDNDLEWRLFCDISDRPGHPRYLSMAYSVNGRTFGAVGCGKHGDVLGAMGTSFDDSADTNRARWASNGVQPGEPVTVRAWLENRHEQRVTAPDVRMGFALYRRTAARIEKDNIVIPTLIDSRGGTYRLTDYTVEPLTDADRFARLAVPAADAPRFVRSGLALEGNGTPLIARIHPYVDGRETGGVVGGGVVGEPLQDRSAHVLGLRVLGGKGRGTLLISVYELVRNS